MRAIGWVVCGVVALLAGCKSSSQSSSSGQGTMSAAVARSAVARIGPSKSATTMPMNNNVTGTVTFTQRGDKVFVVADIFGLEPNTVHGFHIHEFGDLSAADLSSAGGHFNPYHHQHGAPGDGPVHSGDLGNLQADGAGNAHLEITVGSISVGTGAIDDVVGKSVIIHAKADDLHSQPSGNAGARIAGGVIELKR